MTSEKTLALPPFGTSFGETMTVASWEGGAWSTPSRRPVGPLSLHPGAHVAVGHPQTERLAGTEVGPALEDAAAGIHRDGVAAVEDAEGAQGVELRAEPVGPVALPPDRGLDRAVQTVRGAGQTLRAQPRAAAEAPGHHHRGERSLRRPRVEDVCAIELDGVAVEIP